MAICIWTLLGVPYAYGFVMTKLIRSWGLAKTHLRMCALKHTHMQMCFGQSPNAYACAHMHMSSKHIWSITYVHPRLYLLCFTSFDKHCGRSPDEMAFMMPPVASSIKRAISSSSSPQTCFPRPILNYACSFTATINLSTPKTRQEWARPCRYRSHSS